MASQLPAADQPTFPGELNNSCQIPGQAVLKAHRLDPEHLVVEKCGSSSLDSSHQGYTKQEFQQYLQVIKARRNGLTTIRQLQLGNSFQEAELNISSIQKPNRFESTYKDFEALQDMVQIFNENSGMDLKLAHLNYDSRGHISAAPFKLNPSILKSLAAHNSRLIHKIKRIGCSKVGNGITQQLRFLKLQFKDGSESRLLVLSATKIAEGRYEIQSYGARKNMHFDYGQVALIENSDLGLQGRSPSQDSNNLQIQFAQPISATQGLGIIRPFGWESSSDACYLQELIRSQQ
jgi:hypothetical protein